jgi:hypothetical protein
VVNGCPGSGCTSYCGSDQDCAGSPGTICVGFEFMSTCVAFCLQPCSPSGAFLDESFAF